jgi:SAM-dependent methyltransferase
LPAPMTQTDRAARATWAAHYATPRGFRYHPAEELVRFCGRLRRPLGRVLEVGCGSGANLWFLAEHSELAVGVDFCGTALRVAQQVCTDRGCGQETRDSRPGHRCWTAPAVLAAADAFRLPFAAATFDLVADLMVSQHVNWEAHTALYGEYQRVLRPGGGIFLYHLVRGTTGSLEGETDHPAGIGMFPEAGRVCLPDARQLADRLRGLGFVGVEERGMTRTYPDGTRACYAVLEGTAHE